MTNLENAINELIELIRQSNSEQQEQLAGLIRFGMVNLVEKVSISFSGRRVHAGFL